MSRATGRARGAWFDPFEARPAHRVAILAAMAFAFACGGDPEPRTQVMVVLDADAAIQAQVEGVRIRLEAGRDRSAPDRMAEHTVDPMGMWPLRVAIIPHRGDARRRFALEATALGTGGELVVVRARSGFRAGSTLQLSLTFRESCVGVACGQAETCVRGACTTAEVDVTTLARFLPAASDAGAPAVDASAGDAGAGDGGAGDACPPVAETCNGADEDCDGEIDEDAAECPGMCVEGACVEVCEEGFYDCDESVPGCEERQAHGHCGGCDLTCGFEEACVREGCASASTDFFLPVTGADSDRIDAVDLDDFGARYALIRHSRNDSTFAGESITNPTGSTAFDVVAVDREGGFSWSAPFRRATTLSTNYVSVNGMRASAEGLVYVVGQHRGQASLGGISPRYAESDLNAFLTRLNPDGTADWTIEWAGAGNQFARDVDVSPGGTIYVLGQFDTSLRRTTTGPELQGELTRGGFVAAHTPTRSQQWIMPLPYGYSALAAGGERVYAHVLLEGDIQIGDDRYSTEAFKPLIVALDASDGSVLWTKLLDEEGTGYGEEWRSALAADAAGNVYLAHGMVHECFRAVPCPLPSSLDLDGATVPYGLFVVSYDTEGTLRWSRSIEGVLGDAEIQSLRIGRSGELVLAGYAREGFDLGGGPLSVNGTWDGYVAALDPESGAYRWGARLDGLGNERTADATTDGEGQVLLGGYFDDLVLVDDERYTPINTDGFLWSLSPP